MKESLKKISPALFGIALICFMLPWINLTCSGGNVGVFTGIQLVKGTTIEQEGMFGGKEKKKVDPEPLAIATFVFAIVGIATGFLGFHKEENSAIASGIMGITAFISLLLLKSKIDTDVIKQGQGVLRVEYLTGFWITMVSFILTIILNAYLYFIAKKEQVPKL